MNLSVLDADYPARLATKGRLVLVDLLEENASGEGDAMARTRGVAERLAAERRQKVFIGARIRRGSGLPDTDRRQAMVDWLRRNEGVVHAYVWLEGDGFWAAAFRSVIAAFLIASGQRRVATIVGAETDLLAALAEVGVGGEETQAFFDVPHPREH